MRDLRGGRRHADALDRDAMVAESSNSIDVLEREVDRRRHDQNRLLIVELVVLGELDVSVGGVRRSFSGFSALGCVGNQPRVTAPFTTSLGVVGVGGRVSV